MSTPEELEAHARRMDIEIAQVSPLDSPLDSSLVSHYDPSYDLWTSARSKFRNILRRSPNQPLEEIEFDLHNLWDTIIRTAIIAHADKPAQDRLVAEVVLARELGSLDPNAMTADGKLWSRLPFLAGDLSIAWLEKLMYLKTEESLNLAAFTARLLAAGVLAPELGFCAVFVLRETLEKPRPLRMTDYGGSGKSVADLLPAAVAWFKFAGHRLAGFSGENGPKPLWGRQGRLTAVGQLAREAGVPGPGFSTKRWRFWQLRLEELGSVDDKEIREQARQGMNSIDLWSDWVG